MTVGPRGNREGDANQVQTWDALPQFAGGVPRSVSGYESCAGDTITVSFDMKGTAGAGGVIFPELFSEFSGGGATNQILETIAAPTADWTTYSYTTTAGADVSGGITMQFGVVCGGVSGCFADVFIDNVSFVFTSP